MLRKREYPSTSILRHDDDDKDLEPWFVSMVADRLQFGGFRRIAGVAPWRRALRNCHARHISQ